MPGSHCSSLQRLKIFTRADRGGSKQTAVTNAQISMRTAINKTTTLSRQVKMQTFPTLHTNLWKCSRHTFLKEGFRGFYSGTLPGASEENLPRSIEVRTHEQKIRLGLIHMICQKKLLQLWLPLLPKTPCCSWRMAQLKEWSHDWQSLKMMN